MKLPPGVTPRMFAHGVKIETREHNLPKAVTRKLVMDHIKINPKEYVGKR